VLLTAGATVTPSATCGPQELRIYDERGEWIRTLCGTLPALAPGAVTFTASAFAPNLSGPGGLFTLYVNGQVFALWDAKDKAGKVVPNSFYHLVLKQRLADGAAVLLETDVYVASRDSTLSLSAVPNIARTGEVVRLNASFGSGPAPDGSPVKVYAVSGELVRTLALLGGQASWDLANDQGNPVSSGVYLFCLDVMDGEGRAVRRVVKAVVLR
jgi:hypothetical protein